jgi:hypothetical protein
MVSYVYGNFEMVGCTGNVVKAINGGIGCSVSGINSTGCIKAHCGSKVGKVGCCPRRKTDHRINTSGVWSCIIIKGERRGLGGNGGILPGGRAGGTACCVIGRYRDRRTSGAVRLTVGGVVSDGGGGGGGGGVGVVPPSA